MLRDSDLAPQPSSSNHPHSVVEFRTSEVCLEVRVLPQLATGGTHFSGILAAQGLPSKRLRNDEVSPQIGEPDQSRVGQCHFRPAPRL